MTQDAAAFRREDIAAVYGDRPRCPFTLHWQLVDGHHILGRGEDLGIKKDDPRRIAFSSLFNFCPLQRDIHKGPLRDYPEMRSLMLTLAAKRIFEACAKQNYILNNDSDPLFQAILAEWRDRNHL